MDHICDKLVGLVAGASRPACRLNCPRLAFAARGGSTPEPNGELGTCPVPAAGQGPARRETDTMNPSSARRWYYLRYSDPPQQPSCRSNAMPPTGWLPGGTSTWAAFEHAILQPCSISRFYSTKCCANRGLLSFDEPFQRCSPGHWCRPSPYKNRQTAKYVAPAMWRSGRSPDPN